MQYGVHWEMNIYLYIFRHLKNLSPIWYNVNFKGAKKKTYNYKYYQLIILT